MRNFASAAPAPHARSRRPPRDAIIALRQTGGGRRAVAALIVAVVLAVAAGLLASEIASQRLLDEARTKLEEKADRLATEVTGRTRYSPAMGGAMLRGLDEPAFKHAVGSHALKSHEAEAIRLKLRPMRKLFGADGTFLVSGKGEIVVQDTDGRNTVGTNVAFRPYFQQSMAGKPGVYAAVGNNSGDRGLYYTAPVHADETLASKVIGVIVVKLLGDPLDDMLRATGGTAILLSPQGVVFASTENDWLYRLTPPASPERIAEIRALKQFGKRFEEGTAQTLPFSPDAEQLEFAGAGYLAARRNIDWQDPGGDWRIVVLADIATIVPPALRWSVGGSAGLIVLLLAGGSLLAWRGRRNHQEVINRYRMLGTALEEAPVGVMITDAQGRIRWVNPQFEQSTGFSLDEAQGRNGRLIVSEQTPAPVRRAMRAALAAGRVWRGELINRRKNGALYWEQATVSPVFDHAQHLVGFVSLLEDVTERRELIASQQAKIELDERLGRLGRALHGHADPQAMARAALDEIARCLGAPWGAIHVPGGEPALLARFGQLPPAGDAAATPGLVADVASSQQPLILPDLPANCQVELAGSRLALGEIRLLPLGIGKAVHGVLELGLFAPPDEAHQTYLDKAVAELAVALQMALDFSAREKMKASLAEQEERRRLLLEAVGEGIIGVDTTGRTTFVNPAACRLLGYTEAELIDQPLHDLIQYSHADGTPYMRDACPLYETIGQGLASRRDDEVLWRKDGTCFPADYSTLPIHRGEQVLGAVVVFRDISAEHALHRDFLAVLDSSPDIIVLKDAERRFKAVSRSYIESCGRDSWSEFFGHTAEDILPAEMAARIRAEEDELLTSGQDLMLSEQEQLLADGRPGWMAVTRKLMRDGRGKLIGQLMLARDITRIKEAQVALARREAHFRALLESAPDATLLIDMTGHIRLANRAAEKLFGHAPEDFPGLRFEALIPARSRSGYLARLQSAAASGERYLANGQDENVWVHRDGSEFPADVALSPVAGEEGELLVVTIRDITEQKKAALAMEHARRMAEEAARMKSDFLANMSHEIRTPMNAIIGMTHLTLNTALSVRQRDYLHKIQQSGQHLLGIINDILDFSKIEAGKLEIEQVDFELDSVFRNLANLVGEKASDKGLELVFDVAPDVPATLVGDPLRLGQILINYANNAVKFTEQGEIGITVRKEAEEGEQLLLRFSVRDTGIGLSAEQIERLFASFHQADTSTTRKYGGTGLGLAISKRLTELMGGEVGVDSQPGQGATFWFTVRLGKGCSLPSLMPNLDLRGLRVLVVDDNHYARTVLSDMLKSMSFVADTAEGGRQALTALTAAARAGQPYDLLLLDWQMPHMDGRETAEQVNKLKLKHKPHMMVVTAHGREDVSAGAASVGIRHIIIKPVSPSMLLDALMRLVGDRDGAPAGQAAQNRRPEQARGAGARILLVEDNPLNQQVAYELLVAAGFAVDIAANGKLALDMLERNSYDVVLMDMQMPEMDGIAATQAIRRQQHLRDLPIVAMTANAMRQDQQNCLQAGMNDHIAKPIDPEHLMRTLQRWIKPRAGTTEAIAPPVETVEPDLPRDIAGLDVEMGLSHMANRRPLYLSLLGKFAGLQRHTPTEIQAALDKGDMLLALRLAHSLRGAAGTMGAREVQGAAGELEAAIKIEETPEILARRLARLTAVLADLIAGLERNALAGDCKRSA